jgi:hypothetical protein
MKIIKVTTDNQVSTIPITKAPNDFDWQGAIGGWIEIVRPRGMERPNVMIVDEEGLCKGLPINKLGSHLYGGPIAGDILIARETKEYLVGFPDDEAESIALAC